MDGEGSHVSEVRSCSKCHEHQCVCELNPCELGTLAHWDNVFKKELETYKECSIEGENWFGEEITKKMLKYLTNLGEVAKNDPIVDLGCGNGALLLKMAKKGYVNLKGVDFSKKALEYCENYWSSQNQFQIGRFLLDILDHNEIPQPLKDTKLVLDKGTYDAISLNPKYPPHLTRSKYFSTVLELLADGGLLLIASCNWTKEEIMDHSKDYLTHIETLPSPKFTFGGSSGSTVTISLFKKP